MDFFSSLLALYCFAFICADRSGMAASAAPACRMLLCFAAENRKSRWSSGMKVANGALAAGLLYIFGADVFPFKDSFSACKLSIFRFGAEIRLVLELQILMLLRYLYCILQLSLCRSRWNGCVKVPHSCSCLQFFLFFTLENRKS